MSEMKRRQFMLKANKYERTIIDQIALSFLAIISILAICIFYIFSDFTNRVMDPMAAISSLKIIVIVTLMVIPFLFLLVTIWVYKIANKLVGAFERIIRELDTVIETKQKKHLAVRKGDELPSELITRINVLIDRMS